MALEAVVFPQELFIKEPYCHGNGSMAIEEKEKWVGGQGGGGGCIACVGGGGGEGGNRELSCSSLMLNFEEWDVNCSSPEDCTREGERATEHETKATDAVAGPSGRRKRRRTKTCKNKEEVENQRMTHIAVERNRRKLMNEYLGVLRSLMPASYVQRGDQASIIGGAINFVKELEQFLQSLEAEKRMKQRSAVAGSTATSNPFANFFTFPQYSMCSSSPNAAAVVVNEVVAENRSAVADIEVTMVESHANLKVLSRRRPRQLLNMVVGLQSLRLTVLHLNVTTVDQMVLYSFSVKVEDVCQLNSADEIATAVYSMLGKIQEESSGFH